ncbi:MAG: Dabb family protein [Roseiflexaceae bacterium]|nr:Dabb family protein [Roseiflexaceae bacterium]
MLKHLVMFKQNADTDEATLQEIMIRLEALVGEIPGLQDLRCYRGMSSESATAWTFLLDSTLDDQDALQGYLAHPAHVAVSEWMLPFLASRAVVDYEV